MNLEDVIETRSGLYKMILNRRLSLLFNSLVLILSHYVTSTCAKPFRHKHTYITFYTAELLGTLHSR